MKPTLFLSLLLLAGPGHAQDRRVGPPDVDTLFGLFDADGDDVLDRGEVPPPVWRRLRKADDDGDGAVTRAEYEAAVLEIGGGDGS